jgi:hypothetical protein
MIKFHNTACKVLAEIENISCYVASFKSLTLFNIKNFVLEIYLKSDVSLNLVAEGATQNIHFEHKEICVRFEVLTVVTVKSVIIWV